MRWKRRGALVAGVGSWCYLVGIFTLTLALSLRERGFPYAPFLTFPLRGKGLNGYGLRARSCSWRSCCFWLYCQVSKRDSRDMRSRCSRRSCFSCSRFCRRRSRCSSRSMRRSAFDSGLWNCSSFHALSARFLRSICSSVRLSRSSCSACCSAPSARAARQ